MAKNDRTNWDKVKWTPFREGYFPDALPLEKTNRDRVRVYLNSIYQVQIEWLNLPSPFNKTAYLSIKTLDKQPRHDWREMQRIKTELIGAEVESIELYPAESRLVDTANQYHLFCFPELQFEGKRFPFGFEDRLIAEGSSFGLAQSGKGSRQRDFRAELKPPDTVRGDQLDEVYKGIREQGHRMTMGRCPVDGSVLVYTNDSGLGFGEQTAVTGRLQCMKGNHVFFAAKREDIERIEAQEKAKKEGQQDG